MFILISSVIFHYAKDSFSSITKSVIPNEFYLLHNENKINEISLYKHLECHISTILEINSFRSSTDSLPYHFLRQTPSNESGKIILQSHAVIKITRRKLTAARLELPAPCYPPPPRETSNIPHYNQTIIHHHYLTLTSQLSPTS